MTQQQHFATVCFLGVPNAGKSTLLNAILKEHIAPVHKKPQMTRKTLLGLFTADHIQLAFVDTPGLHDSSKALNQRMMKELEFVLDDADLILVLLPVDELIPDLILKQVSDVIDPRRCLFVLNKCDLQQNAWKIDLAKIETYVDGNLFRISAQTGDGVDALLAELCRRAPVNPFLYDGEDLTTASTREVVCNYLHESLMEYLHEEIPYETYVHIDAFHDEPKKAKIMASIIVNQESQKGIVIGKGGQTLERIRKRTERLTHKLIDKAVTLQIHVKVDQGWTKQSKKIDTLF